MASTVDDLGFPMPGMPRYADMTTTGRVTGGPEVGLATYGTLAPGRPNNGRLNELPGRWLVGHVRGSLPEAGWGATLGYPGLILDPYGPPVEVHVFESGALPHHWGRLEAFEGSGYRRRRVDCRGCSARVDLRPDGAAQPVVIRRMGDQVR
jgi:gamma-glutamylcyclotransferase (GGCT)/AIG2-like uncharacterized protein YtfP